MNTTKTPVRRALGCVLVAVAGTALAAEKPQPIGPAERVTVSFAVQATPAQAVTTRWLTMEQDLAVGQSFLDTMNGMPFSFGVGGEQSGCGARLATEPPESLLQRYPLVWSAQAKLLAASTDSLGLAVSWKRFTPAEPSGAAASEQIEHVELREGDRVLLDFAHAPSPCLRNAALEVTAQLREDPALAAKRIAYDVWLVHQVNGRRKTARVPLSGLHGEQLRFVFPAEELAVSGAAGERLRVAVSGDLRGRLRTDGTLDLSLGSVRALAYVAPDGSSDGGISDGGRKRVRVRPGEVIKVELPPPTASPAYGDPRAQRMSRDLQGSEYALIVKAQGL